MTPQGGSPPTPRRIILVRHGATEWSRAGRHTGRTDLPLLGQGETEARELGGKLSGLLEQRGAGVVVSSPLRRALETSRLAGFGGAVEVDGDLAEWDYGDYEGLTTAEIRTRRPGWDLFRDGCPGGEQAEDVAERAGRVIARLRSCPRLSGETAVLFAHGHVLRVLAAVWAGFGARAGGALSLTTGRLGVLSWEHESEALERWNV